MNPILERLIDLYTLYASADVESNGGRLLLEWFGVSSHEALLALDGYDEAFAQVSGCADLLRRLTERYKNKGEQVIESLRLLRRMTDDAESDIRIITLRRLIEGRLYNRLWDSPEQTAYDQKKELLEWKDFFLSYTNRDGATNERFRALVKSCFSKYPLTGGNFNYVAQVISHHLQGYQHLSGFFDRDKLKVGEDIQEKVDEYCRRCFAFVQLVEPLTFSREPPKNWCFHEYQQFSANSKISKALGNKDRHCFVLIDEKLKDLLPANIPPVYAEWSARMGRVLTISISGYKRNAVLMPQLKEIAKQILKVRAEIIDAWLIS